LHPAHKRLTGTFARAPATEELRQSHRGEPVGGDCRQEGEHGLVFAQVDVRDLLEEADVPSGGCALVLLGLLPESPQNRSPRVRPTSSAQPSKESLQCVVPVVPRSSGNGTGASCPR
jgi:hypothetical protein